MSDVSLPQRHGARAAAPAADSAGRRSVALVWIAVILPSRCCADLIAPYSITALDLRNRLAAAAATPRICSAPTNLAATCCPACLLDPRLAADCLRRHRDLRRARHLARLPRRAFPRLVEQLVLMLTDFQASMPFLILALAVLAFFGNSLPLLSP